MALVAGLTDAARAGLGANWMIRQLAPRRSGNLGADSGQSDGVVPEAELDVLARGRLPSPQTAAAERAPGKVEREAARLRKSGAR